MLRGQTKEDINKSVVEFKQSINLELNNVLNKTNVTLDVLLGKALVEVDKFNEFQQAIDLSKKTLSLHHNIQITAETLENLVTEHSQKKKSFESEADRIKEEIEMQITAKKRDWEREREEYGYNLKLQRKKEVDLYEEEKVKCEKDLAAKEDALCKQEEEYKKLQQEASDFPKRLEKELMALEKEVTSKLNEEFDSHQVLMKKDADAEKRFYNLQIENLQDQIKKQETEIVALKKEAEAAGKKAQELAVKVIERGGRDIGASERNVRETM